MHGLRYLDGPLYARTALKRVNETRVQAAAGTFDV